MRKFAINFLLCFFAKGIFFVISSFCFSSGLCDFRDDYFINLKNIQKMKPVHAVIKS